MTIDQKMIAIVKGLVDTFGDEYIITRAELYTLLGEKYGVTQGSVIPSDYCYNRINAGIVLEKKPALFEFLGKGRYRCLGENYPYNGDIYHKNKIVGICQHGVRKLFNNE